MRYCFLVSLIFLFLFAGWVASADKIVLVAAAVPLGAEDELVHTHLEDWGFEVELHSQDEAQPVDISGATAVYILESCGSGSIASAYNDTPIPVINAETWTFDDMHFAPDGTFHHDIDQTLVIEDPTHPIAGGLTGEVEVTSEPKEVMSCSDMQGDVRVVATVSVNGDACIASYEKGAELMDGSKTPERRACIFVHTTEIPVLTDDGWGLVKRSVLWAIGQLAPVTPKGALAVTWGALKADCR